MHFPTINAAEVKYEYAALLTKMRAALLAPPLTKTRICTNILKITILYEFQDSTKIFFRRYWSTRGGYVPRILRFWLELM